LAKRDDIDELSFSTNTLQELNATLEEMSPQERKNMRHTFEAILQKLPGKIQWTVFYVPFSVHETYGTNGRLRVKGTIDGHDFAGTLLPSKNGHYPVYNRQIRERCQKDIGDVLEVEMERDHAPRTLEVPDEILHELEKHHDAFMAFKALPAYMKREAIHHIMAGKRQETRNRRIQKFIHSLVHKR
jgi:hypothetical protein